MTSVYLLKETFSICGTNNSILAELRETLQNAKSQCNALIFFSTLTSTNSFNSAKQTAKQFACVRNFGQKLRKAKKSLRHIMLSFHFTFLDFISSFFLPQLVIPQHICLACFLSFIICNIHTDIRGMGTNQQKVILEQLHSNGCSDDLTAVTLRGLPL